LSIAIPLCILSVWLWMRTLDTRGSLAHAAMAAMLFLGSYPVVQAIHLQQLALFIFGLIALAVAAIDHGMFASAGVALVVVIIKPQTTIPVAAWFFFWSLMDWKDRKRLIISFTATMGVLCAGASLLLPGWVGDWREGASSYVGYTAGVPAHVQVVFGRYA